MYEHDNRKQAVYFFWFMQSQVAFLLRKSSLTVYYAYIQANSGSWLKSTQYWFIEVDEYPQIEPAKICLVNVLHNLNRFFYIIKNVEERNDVWKKISPNTRRLHADNFEPFWQSFKGIVNPFAILDINNLRAFKPFYLKSW